MRWPVFKHGLPIFTLWASHDWSWSFLTYLCFTLWQFTLMNSNIGVTKLWNWTIYKCREESVGSHSVEISSKRLPQRSCSHQMHRDLSMSRQFIPYCHPIKRRSGTWMTCDQSGIGNAWDSVPWIYSTAAIDYAVGGACNGYTVASSEVPAYPGPHHWNLITVNMQVQFCDSPWEELLWGTQGGTWVTLLTHRLPLEPGLQGFVFSGNLGDIVM